MTNPSVKCTARPQLGPDVKDCLVHDLQALFIVTYAGWYLYRSFYRLETTPDHGVNALIAIIDVISGNEQHVVATVIHCLRILPFQLCTSHSVRLAMAIRRAALYALMGRTRASLDDIHH